MTASTKIRMIIADDHALVRSGLIKLLGDIEDILIISEAEDGNDLVKKYFRSNPDVILVDINMPHLTGTEAVKRIHAKDKNVKALFLSMYEEEEYIYHTYKAGGMGFINKNILKNELVKAIKTVYKGEYYFGNKISEDELKDIIEKYDFIVNPIKDEEKIHFTSREKEILKLISNGLTSGDISERLELSKRTVDTHRSNIMSKANIKSLPELIKYAIKFGEEKI
ncbi:MAG: response regulator transcription factor [Melioribacteraceae bacterium]|nr:response regulator transcription factor [Melioribacteraceae bacterium]MCF8353790.1 response regulator transcription factor [Melioribacteraceae bacterium]MCF8393626.1 response regulator transcription factor [Melioribacteraceae bacterium]MCF8419436.1 response regulator transcription factor [Melioribacteraceae bacterium]